MKGVRRFRDRLKKDLKSSEFRKAFDEEEIFASLAIRIAEIRRKKQLTQQDLARRLHTTQETVSRLENVHNESYTVSTLFKVARALDKQLKVELV